ncbi:MAG: hypothetical protein EOM08_03280, partial [Clostridia bacterium]|nr:hypothetical protein [Clostridia bacterium]
MIVERYGSRFGRCKYLQWAAAFALIVLLVLTGPPWEPSNQAVWASSTDSLPSSELTETAGESPDLVSEPAEPASEPSEPIPEPTEPVTPEVSLENTATLILPTAVDPTEPMDPVEPDPSPLMSLLSEPSGNPEEPNLSVLSEGAEIPETMQTFTSTDQANAIQQAVDAALGYALANAATTDLTIEVQDGQYQGGLSIIAASGDVLANPLTLTIQAHDAGNDLLSSAGNVRLSGDLQIDYPNLNLILAGIYLSLDKMAQAQNIDGLTIFGTTDDDTLVLDTNGVALIAIHGGDGQDSLTVTSSGQVYDPDATVLTGSSISLDGGSGDDRIKVETNTAFSANGPVAVTVSGGNGSGSESLTENDRLDLTGTLDDASAQPITGDASAIVMQAMAGVELFGTWQIETYRKPMAVTMNGLETVTDDLANKWTVPVGTTQDIGPVAGQSFTDYQVAVDPDIPIDASVNLTNAADLFLTKVVARGDSIQVQNLVAPGLDIVLSGRQIQALAESRIEGRSVQIDALDDDSHTISLYENSLNSGDPANTLDEIEVSTFDLTSAAGISIASGAQIVSGRSIDLTARSVQTAPLLPTFEKLLADGLGEEFSQLLNFNFLAIKTGRAIIQIHGLLQAVQAIRATALALIHVSAASDNISLIMPLSIGVVDALAQVITGDGARLEAGTDVVLRASTDVDLTAAARTGFIPVALAVSSASGQAEVTVGGNSVLDADQGSIVLAARGRMNVLTEATEPSVPPMVESGSLVPGSGGYFAFSIIKQLVKAQLTDTARATAGADLTILADAREKVTNTAQSSASPNGNQYSLSNVLLMLTSLQSLAANPQGVLGSGISALSSAAGNFVEVIDGATTGSFQPLVDNISGGSESSSSFQLVGALGVLYATNQSLALLTTTSPVSVTGTTQVLALQDSQLVNTADGSPVGGASSNGVGIGVGVAVTILHHTAQALVSAPLEAASLIVHALSYHLNAATTAKAGASYGSIGLAGAIAVQIIDALNEAKLLSAANVTLKGGSFELLAKILNSVLSTTADVTADSETGKFGLGAGIAVAVTAITSQALIEAGAALRHATDTQLASFRAEAGYHGTEATSAKAGGSGGISLIPALALTISNVFAEAIIGLAPAEAIPLDVAGDVDVHSDFSMERESSADATSKGTTANVGMSLSVNILHDKSSAKLSRSIRARNIRVRAASISRVQAKARASEPGADPMASFDTLPTDEAEPPPEDPDASPEDAYGEMDDIFADVDPPATTTDEESGAADQLADDISEGASGLLAYVGQSSIDPAQLMARIKGRKQAATSEGRITVSAAFVLNLLTHEILSEVNGGSSLTATEAISITSDGDTDGKAIADASATASQLGVGVAVTVQDISYENIARIGDARITAGSLTLAANTYGADWRGRVENLIDALISGIADAAGMTLLANWAATTAEPSLFDGLSADVKSALIEELLYQAFDIETTYTIEDEIEIALINEKLAYLLTILTDTDHLALYFATQLATETLPEIRVEATKYLAALFGSNDELTGLGNGFSTQSISGAGGSKVGIAGSVAISSINGTTQAIIDNLTTASDPDIDVTGETLIFAQGVQTIYTTAGSTADLGVAAKGKKKRAANTTPPPPPTPPTPPPSGSGSGGRTGIGASFALSLGETTVEAILGDNRRIASGSLGLEALAWNDVETIAVAGQDPMGRKDEILESTDPESKDEGVVEVRNASTNTTTANISVDAAVALNLTSNTVQSLVLATAVITTTGSNTILVGPATYANYVQLARLNGRTLTDAKGNASGATAVGAAVAINLVESTTQASFLGTADLSGAAQVVALTSTADDAHALATAMGADITRYLNAFRKLRNAGAALNSTQDILLEKLGAHANNEDDSGTPPISALPGAPASTNALHTQNISTTDSPNLDEAQDGIDDNVDPQDTGETDGEGNPVFSIPQIPGKQQTQSKSKLHVAAAVAVNVTSHSTLVIFGGSFTAQSLIINNGNFGNFRTLGTGIAATMPGGTTSELANIGVGVAVSVNANKALTTLGGTITARGVTNDLPNDGTITVDTQLTQNLDGEYRGLLAAQALAGSVSGKATVGLAGAVAVLVSKAQTGTDLSASGALNGGAITLQAIDQSKLAVRAGTLTFSTGANIGAGASFALIYAHNQVHVHIGNQATITATSLKLNAQKKAVTADDYVPSSGLLSILPEGEDPITLSDISESEDKVIDLVINADTDAMIDAINLLNFLTSANYYAEAIAGTVITGTAATAALAGSFAFVILKNNIQTQIGTGAVITLTGNLDADAVSATNARIIAGALSLSSGKAGVGLTVGFLFSDEDISLQLAGTIHAGGLITADATQTNNTQVITITAAVTTSGVGIGGVINLIVNETSVLAEILDNSQITAANDLLVKASSDNDLLLIALTLTVGGGQAAAGGTAAVIIDGVSTKALTGTGVQLTSTNGSIELSSASQAKLLAVLASASGSTGSAAVAGTVSVLITRATTEASVGNLSTLNAGQDIRILAASDVWMLSVLASLAGTSGNVAVGATINVFVYNRTLTAKTGTSVTLIAGRNVLIQALAKDWTALVSAAGAAASTAAVSGVIVVVVGSSQVLAEIGADSTITADGSIGLIAHQDTELYNAAGGFAAASTAGVGVTLVATILRNTVTSQTGPRVTLTALALLPSETGISLRRPNREETRRGIIISATATEMYVQVAISGAAAGTAAVSGVIETLILKNKTKAIVGDDSDLIAGDIGSEAELGDEDTGILVEADDDSHLWLAAGALSAAGTAGIGITALVLIYDKTVFASLGSEQDPEDTSPANTGTATANGDILIRASSADQLVILAVNFAASGTVAVGIGGNLLLFQNVVQARASGTLTARRNVIISADSDSDLFNIAVSATGSGTVAVGGAAVVTYFSGQTIASVAEESTLTAGGAVQILADSKELVSADAAGLAITGTAAISGAVVVIITEVVTKAYTEDQVTLTGRKLDVLATDRYRLLSIAGTLAVSGVAGVGVTAIVSYSSNSIGAGLGTNNTVTTTESSLAEGEDTTGITLRAQSDRQVRTYALTIGGGQVGVGATLMVVIVGGKLTQDTADELSKGFQPNDFTSQMFATAPSQAASYEKTDLGSQLAGDGIRQSQTSIGGSDEFDGTSGYRGTEEDPAPEDLAINDSASSDLNDASGQYSSRPAFLPKDSTSATVGNGSTLTSGSDITVQAHDNLTADLVTGTITGGLYAAVGAGIAVAVLFSNVIAVVSDGATLSADGNILIEAKAGSAPVPFSADRNDMNRSLEGSLDQEAGSITSLTIRAISFTGGGAIVGVSIAVATIALSSNVIARLSGDVTKADQLEVHAITSYPGIMTATLTIAGGGVGIGASIALVLANSQSEASIAGNATISNTGTIRVHSDSAVTTLTVATAAAAGGVSVNGGISLVVNRLRTDTFIGQGVTITGTETDLTVESVADVSAQAFLVSLAYGSVAVNLSIALVILQPTVLTYIGSTPGAGASSYPALSQASGLTPGGRAAGQITVRDITVQNDLTDHAQATILAFAAGSTSVNGMVLLVFDRSLAVAGLSNANVHAHDITVDAFQDSLAQSLATSLAVGGVAIGANVSYVQLRSDNRAILDASLAAVSASGAVGIYAGRETDVNQLVVQTLAVAGNAGAIAVGLNVAIADQYSQNRAIVTLAPTGTTAAGLSVTGQLTVAANSAATANATVYGVNAGGLAILASFAIAVLRNVQEATVMGTGTLQAGSLAIIARLNENDEPAAGAEIGTGAGGLISANVLVAVAYGRSSNLATLTVRRFIVTNAVELLSSGSAIVTGYTLNLSNIGYYFTAAVMIGLAYAQSNFEARVTVTDQPAQSVDASAGSLSIKTDSLTRAETTLTPSAGGVSTGMLNLKINTATAISSATNSAKITGAGTLAVSGDVFVEAQGTALAKTATLDPVLDLGILTIAANVSTATLRAVQTASIDTVSLTEVDNLTVQSLFNVGQTEGALARLGGNGTASVSASLIEVRANAATATANASNTASISQSAITASGLLTIASHGTSHALATVRQANGTLSLAGIGITHLFAYANGTFTASLDTTGVTVRSDAISISNTYLARSEALALPPNGGLGGIDLSGLQVKLNIATAVTDSSATAGILGSGTAHTTQDLAIRITGIAHADAQIPASLISVSGVSIVANVATATVSASQTASIVDSTISAGGDLDVVSILNRTEASPAATGWARATTGSTGGNISFAAFSAKDNAATAWMKTSSLATVTGATVYAGGQFSVVSFSRDNAIADADAGTSFSLAGIGAVITIAWIDSTSTATLGDDTYVRAGSLVILATADELATATAQANSGGLASGSGNFATIVVKPVVTASTGLRSDIRTT